MSTVYFTHSRVALHLTGNAMAALEGGAMEGGRGAPGCNIRLSRATCHDWRGK